jgi:hypothetical protein
LKNIGRPSKIPTKRRFLEVCTQCESVDEVALRLDISKRSVYRYAKIYKLDLNNFGIPIRYLPVPDSIKLRQKICKMYLHNHSVIETYRQLRGLHWKRERITRVLKEEGFIINKYTAAKVKKHFSGAHNVSISDELQTLIDGEVLGDGQLFCQADTLKQKHTQPISVYLNAFNLLGCLIKNQTANYQDLCTIIEEYNKIVEIISKTQVAGFHIHKSVLEEPWIRWLANLFNKHKYSVTIVPPKKSIHMITPSTVQLYQEYKRWYPKGIKAIPTTLRLTPNTTLHWYVGDGSAGKHELTLNTQSFNEANNKLLMSLLKKVLGVKARLQPYKSRSFPQKTLFKLCITSRKNIGEFFKFLEDAPKNSLSFAKQLLPWKFDCTLRKKDVYNPKTKFVDDNYLNSFFKMLKQVKINPSDRKEQLHHLFPWEFPIENKI